MVQGGVWGGKRVLSEDWIDVSTRSGQEHVARCGLLWWIVPESTSESLDGEAEGQVVSDRPLGYYAQGFLGQWLVVLPKAQLVVVRQIRGPSRSRREDTMSDFVDLVRALVKT
jgi:CubicO group peptidase (beta-lactamase class C family)